MKSSIRFSAFPALVLLALAQPVAAQYMRITTDNPTDNTRLRSSGTTVLTITLNTNHDRDNTLQTCNSHSAALCGGVTTPNPLTLFSYQVYLRAVSGTVQWGTFTPDTAAFTALQPQVQDNFDVEFTFARPPGSSSPPGFSSLGRISVTPTSGTPRIEIARFPDPTPLDPASFGTSFGTHCDAGSLSNTYVLGDRSDPCGATSGLPPDWYDADGALPAAGPGSPPVLDPIANMTIGVGGCAPSSADQAISASDPDGDAIFFTSSGPAWMTVTGNAQVGNTRTGNIHLSTPPSGTTGPVAATVTATAGVLSDSKSFTITVAVVDQAPVLAQPMNMSVPQGGIADQTITASDACGAPLTFIKVSGPTFMTVTTTNAGTGTATGNIHLAPGPAEPLGTYAASVAASNGTLSNSKSFVITIGGNRAPVLDPIANMQTCEGSTADQVIRATDADGNAVVFSKAAGPTFMTVTTTNTGTGTATGNIHIAPGFADAGTASATVQASDGSLISTRSFAITITNACRPPVIGPVSSMTVTEGQTANQTITAASPDGAALSFIKVSGPVFMTVSTTNPGTGSATGNIHLAPGFSDAGTYNATVGVTDGSFLASTTFMIFVAPGANRCPTANADGPYSGIVGATITFDGTGSSDPDGEPLTYMWDFGDGTTGTGSMPNHVYVAVGNYTVTLTVADPSGCSDIVTTLATITGACPATIFNGYDTIRLGSGKPYWFGYVQPTTGCYENTDVSIASFVMKYAGRQISASGKTSTGVDKNGDGIQEIKVSFSKDDLRTLFTGTGLPNGHNLVTVTLEASLVTGGIIQGTTQLDVVNNGNFSAPTVAPNPLNPSATLTYTTSRAGNVRIDLFDIQGRLVRTLVDEPAMAAGTHEAVIDGRGKRGEKLPSGVYYIRGKSNEGEFKQVITILK